MRRAVAVLRQPGAIPAAVVLTLSIAAGLTLSHMEITMPISYRDYQKQMQLVSSETYARMVEIALEMGDYFGKEPVREKMLLWLDEMRRELIDELDWGPYLVENANMVDRFLDLIEARRTAIRGSHL